MTTLAPPAVDRRLARFQAASEWLDRYRNWQAFDRLADACGSVTAQPDGDRPDLDPADAAAVAALMGEREDPVDSYNRAMVTLKTLFAEDPTPIVVGHFEVYRNDRGRPAYRPLASEEVVPC